MLQVLKKNRHTSSGMTLVEMLMVMAIFSVVMMAVMSLFIPAVKSTAVQTQVTDVQSNLRLAMNRMTLDLLTAGFLIKTEEPIIFESGADKDPVDFTIQTAAAGSGFGRVASVSGTTLTLSHPRMVESFPDGSEVRLFNPVTAAELDNTVYTVSPSTAVVGALTISGSPPSIDPETIVVRIKPGTTENPQTIRYRLEGDSLVRIVNGAKQFLARNVGSVNFEYFPLTGKINRVEITLTGRTKAVGTDAISTEKIRELKSSVNLRNVF